MPMIAPAAEWDSIVRRLKTEAPEAFLSDGRVLNLIEGEWRAPQLRRPPTPPVDCLSPRRHPPIDLEAAREGGKHDHTKTPPTPPGAPGERRGAGSDPV